ncbi:YjbH domain-containing protein [Fluviibacter sp.]
MPTDVINMPTARLLPDGTWAFDYSFGQPYASTKTGVTILPWLEAGGGVTRIRGVPGFSADNPTYSGYGDYKDKNFYAKALLYNESKYLPAAAFFFNDPEGTGLFQGKGGVLSKKIGPVDLSAGYGSVRPSGGFGGAKIDLWDKNDHQFKALLEIDGNKYKNDPFAAQTGLNAPQSRFNYGLQYDSKLFGAKISHQGANNTTTYEAFIKIPLDDRNLIPKVDEPDRYRKITPQPSAAQWQRNPAYRRQLIKVLIDQDFRDITVKYDDTRNVLIMTGSNSRISQMSRAVGRATQAALLLCPLETDEIQFTYVDKRIPLVTYSFTDLKKLRRYFNGQIPRKDVQDTVLIQHAKKGSYSNPQDAVDNADQIDDVGAALNELRNENAARQVSMLTSITPSGIGLHGFEDYNLRLSLDLFTYLDGPGSFQYALNAFAGGNVWLLRRTELKGGLMFPLAENLTNYPTVNVDSGLPTVRSNIAQYYYKKNLKAQQAVLNNYQQLGTSTYARLSGGIYELQYSGFGGQILHAPQGKNWAVDLSADQVYQRNYEGWFGTNGYNVLTTIASFHYRLPMGITATLRGGQFLAKDRGGRIELARTFRSGFELGAWYTVTNAKESLGGSNSYNDKGVWMRIPFDYLTTQDTRNVANIYYSPWGANAGQMVQSPQDLYRLIDGPYRYNLSENRALDRLADIDEDPSLPELGSSRNVLNTPFLNLAEPDVIASSKGFFQGSTMGNILIGTGITALSSVADRSFHSFADRNGQKGWAKGITNVGNALPYVALGGAGIAALSDSTRLADTGFAALLSTGLSVGMSYGLKYAVGREGPNDTTNPYFFKPGMSNASFPSTHESALSGAIAPFAREYGANWLYGANIVTGLGRILSNNHWFSDTVGGSLLGMGIGNLVWSFNTRQNENAPKVYIHGTGIGMSVPLQ